MFLSFTHEIQTLFVRLIYSPSSFLILYGFCSHVIIKFMLLFPLPRNFYFFPTSFSFLFLTMILQVSMASYIRFRSRFDKPFFLLSVGHGIADEHHFFPLVPFIYLLLGFEIQIDFFLIFWNLYTYMAISRLFIEIIQNGLT